MKRHILLRATVLSSLCFLGTLGLGRPVNFGLPDYAELGNIRDRVYPALEELSLAEGGLIAGIDYVDVISQAISGAPSAGLSSGAIQIASLINAGNDIRNATGAESVQQLAGSFSPIDVSGIRSALRDFGNQLDRLNRQTSSMIEPPTLQLYYAVPVSNRAASDARDLLSRTNTGIEGFGTATQQVAAFQSVFGQYQQRVNQARQVAGQVSVAINDLMQESAASPINYPILYPMLLDAISTEESFRQLGAEVASIGARLDTAASQVGSRLGEATDLRNSLEYALSAPPLPSSWETSITNLSGADNRYELSFEGNSFDHPYTEIEGEFVLGTVTVRNLISPRNQGGVTVSQDLRFEAARTVDDPLLGTVETIGTHDLTMTYTPTVNIEGDPQASMDYFSIPYLGVNVRIFEEDEFSFVVRGRYDSPLRISSIEAVEGETGGFIEAIVPEPSTAALFVCAATALACRPVRSRC